MPTKENADVTEDDFGSWDKGDEAYTNVAKVPQTAWASEDNFEDDWSSPATNPADNPIDSAHVASAPTQVPVTDWDWEDNDLAHTSTHPTQEPLQDVEIPSPAPTQTLESHPSEYTESEPQQAEFFQETNDAPLFDDEPPSEVAQQQPVETERPLMFTPVASPEEEHVTEDIFHPDSEADQQAPTHDNFDQDSMNDEPAHEEQVYQEMHDTIVESDPHAQEQPAEFDSLPEDQEPFVSEPTPISDVFMSTHVPQEPFETVLEQPIGVRTPSKPSSASSTPLGHSTSSLPSLHSNHAFHPQQAPSTPSATDGKEALRKLLVVQSKLKEQSKLIESLQQEKESLTRLWKEEKEARETQTKIATSSGRDSPAGSSDKLKFELSSAREQLSTAKEELKKAKAEVERQKNENEALKKSHSEHHDAVVQHLNDQVNRYAKMADEVKTRALEKSEQWASKMEEKKAQIERLETLLESHKRDHARELEALSSTHEDAAAHSKSGFDKIRRSMEEKWEKERSEFNAQLKSLQSQIDLSLASSQKKDDSIVSLERQLSILTAEVTTLRSGEAEEAKRKWAERQSIEDSLEHSNAQLQARIDELQRQRDAVTLEHTALQAQLAKAHAKSERAVSAVQTKLDAQLDLYASLQAEYADYKTRAAAIVKQLETEKTVLEGERAVQGRVLDHSSSSLGAGSLPTGGLLEGVNPTYSLTAVVHSNPHLMQLLSEAIESLSELPAALNPVNTAPGTEASELAQVTSTLTSLLHQNPMSVSGIEIDSASGSSDPSSGSPTISSSDLISVVASLSNSLKESHRQVSRLLLQAEEDQQSSGHVSPTPDVASLSSSSITSLQVTLSQALLDKSRLEQDLSEVTELKDSLSRQVTSLHSSLQTREQQVEAYEKEKKDNRAALDLRLAQKDEDIIKLRRQLAARSASATATAELESRVKSLSDQLIAKQAIVDAMEAEKRSLEDWASGVPGTASKPKRKAVRSPQEGLSTSSSSVEDASSSRSSLYFKDGQEFDPEDSEAGDEQDGVSLPLGASTTTTPSLLSARSLADVKASLYTRARIVHRQLSNKVGVHPTAQKIASLMPRTVLTRLLLFGYLVALQLFVFYLLSSSSSSAASVTTNEKQT
jgi:hypothetical protein